MRKSGIFAIVAFFAILAPLSAAAEEPVGLAVLDLDAIGVSPLEARALSEKLRSSISTLILSPGGNIKQPYSLLERSQMDKIIEQFNVQNTGCTDISCAVEFGQMLNVQQILIGSVSLVGQLYLVSLRIVDVGSSMILASKEGQVRGSIDDVIGLVDTVGREILTGETGQTPPPQETAKKPEPLSQPTQPKEKKVYFTIRLGQGGFRDDRSELGKLGGGQLTLDIKPWKYPAAISISSEYYTNSPDPTHSYEIAGLTAINLLYMTKPLKSERTNVFLGGGIGRLKVPKGENEPDAWVKSIMYNLEGGINVRLFWKIGFYGIGKYLYAQKKNNNIKVIDFSECIVLLGFTLNFGF